MEENKVRKILAKNLKQLMKEHNIDQKELAEALGVSQPTVSNWIQETKYPRIKRIQQIADYFNVPKSRLISDREPEQQTVAAHFDKEGLTQEEIEEVNRFIEWVKNRDK
ncbi:TPA: helix-turn-helix domain-containing protein [Staphylococcus pseudintermedius]|uniref:helix-turn-helix domain-containing protein n=1 Tax=Staphylococcus coagulans TaxID=74706 RepID=UPI0019F56FFA|nr:transcriptional regulator [Staphylococcus pseudintermedius]EHT1768982.1 helix-turn-helix transcriptional regulator [Staphylococcus pseudintermedius]